MREIPNLKPQSPLLAGNPKLQTLEQSEHDRMVGPGETMRMTANSFQLLAYGPDVDETRIVEDLPKAKPPPAHLTTSFPLLPCARERWPYASSIRLAPWANCRE